MLKGLFKNNLDFSSDEVISDKEKFDIQITLTLMMILKIIKFFA